MFGSGKSSEFCDVQCPIRMLGVRRLEGNDSKTDEVKKVKTLEYLSSSLKSFIISILKMRPM